VKDVLLLLANGFEVYEAAAFIDVLGWAHTFGSDRIRVVTAGLHPELTCTFGYQSIPAVLVSELDPDGFDALAIPGGFGTAGFYEDAFSNDFLEVVRAFAKRGKPIAAVCVASLCLGRCGALKGRSATTYHLEKRKKMQLAGMGALVEDRRIVRDGNLITSTSPGTAVETAFLLLEILTSRQNAEHLRRLMGFS
jgi:4-methyl-5(b-hydroxyethyl)-thiazole monophosphate biosynthesis